MLTHRINFDQEGVCNPVLALTGHIRSVLSFTNQFRRCLHFPDPPLPSRQLFDRKVAFMQSISQPSRDVQGEQAMTSSKRTEKTTMNAGDAPAWLGVDPAWKCAGYPVNPSPNQAEAFAKLNDISQLIYGMPCPNPPTGDMALELQELLNGGAAINVIASLSTGSQFVQLIWAVAVGAAFDHCIQVLGIQKVKEIQDLRQGYIDGFFQAYQACSPDAKGALDFGWIIASVLSTQQWANLNHDCNELPPYRLGDSNSFGDAE